LKEIRYIFVLFQLFLTGCRSSLPQFDGERAYQSLVKQVEFGPRYPGSSGHEKALSFIKEELSHSADRVLEQKFRITNHQSPITNHDTLELTNIIASFDLEKGNRILLCAHWDTRPWADQDPNPENHNKPIPGANDGASGVACLLEIARIIHQKKSRFGVDIVLFDGEDMGYSIQNEKFKMKNDLPLPYGGYLLGSTYFAQNLREYRPQYGILLDMVGDRNLEIYIEGNSNRFAPEWARRIFEKAKGIPQFHPEVRYTITDDHIPLNQAGIPTLVLIDFDYPYWHTLEDTPDKCSPESLQAVGNLLVRVLYK